MMKKQPPSSRIIPTYKDEFELENGKKGLYTCGIDEVGRGCLAGPLVTAAVILPLTMKNVQLHDSKELSVKELQQSADWIVKNCWYAVAISSHCIIDKYNIWNATLLTMKKALIHLLIKSPIPTTILVDVMPLSLQGTAYNNIPIYHFPHGEKKSSSIAAASIIAKVTRDNLMKKYNKFFPGFSLDEHKGYGTEFHMSLLKHRPPLIIHRQTFLHFKKQDDHEKQQTIC